MLETICSETDNNPLTYIFSYSQYRCHLALLGGVTSRITFSIEYQTSRDNAVADALSHVMSKLNAEAVKSILDMVTIGPAGRADAQNLMAAEADERIHKQVKETAIHAWAAHTCVNLHATDWVAMQQEDSILKIVMEWITSHKAQDFKHLLGDHITMKEGKAILMEREKFMLHQGALYHCHTPARELEEALQFVVPTAHRMAAMNGCHRDAGHQGQ